MKWRTVAIVGVVLFLAGFLLGFIPQYRKVSTLSSQLETARLQNKLRQIRELASLSYMDASRETTDPQAKIQISMFSLATEVAADTKDGALRNSLKACYASAIPSRASSQLPTPASSSRCSRSCRSRKPN